MRLDPKSRSRVLALAAAALLASLGPAAEAGAAQTRPNVVVVMTDDQRVYDMEAMPLTRRLLGEAGTSFENSFATYPLCCPSRSTFLSGQYAHNHGVLDNEAPEGGYGKFDFSNALGVWLQTAGYRTAHIGKQLNEYGAATQPAQQDVAPGYDDWFATRDPSTYSMYNYVVQDNGVRRLYGELPADYQTDVLADRAVQDIREWAPDDRPFFIHFAPSAVHWEFYDAENGPRPAPRHASAFASHAFHPRANYDEEDISDKPSVVRHYQRIDPALQVKVERTHRTRLEALLSVDEAVARLVQELEQAGELDNTVIFFTSDNGYLHGEHRMPSEKVVPYEESARVPLLVRGPGFPAGATRRQLTGNIDLAPTIVELAGASAGRPMDGESLRPFAQAPAHRRARSLVLEADFPEVAGPTSVVVPPYHQGVNVYYDAIRTTRYKYVHWFRDVEGNPADEKELYDLEADPFELQSLHASPRHAELMATLEQELQTFKDCQGEACRRTVRGPAPPCLKAPLRLRRSSVGPLRLGATRQALLLAAGSPGRVRARAWRYCVRGPGRLHAVFSAAGGVRLSATTSRTRGTRGIRRGSRSAALRRAYPQSRALSRGLVAASPRSRLLFRVRAGRVRLVVLADRGLRGHPRTLARYLRRAGL
jgi:N-acetylglucosamine-6-sulfatase